jgi:hypothetical protein|tara:strand:- start:1048 stop:2436 length:1389 start_codon:yes stop_codon:yes gene_type:complete
MKYSATKYRKFLKGKSQLGGNYGFEAIWRPDFLFDFQHFLVDWALRKGRAAIFADCGLGKTPMQLVWAENIVRKTKKPVLILAPLAVAPQTIREGEKFGIDCTRSNDGTFPKGARVVVTNYEKLAFFNSADFAGCVCDESSILKNFKGVRRAAITEFMRTMRYRLLCTATAAPNDYIELGTSSECLGELGHQDMLERFFKHDQNSSHPNRQRWGGEGKWRFRGHSEPDFWRWVCSWARAIRKPSDIGFDDGDFKLPPLVTEQHCVQATTLREGWLIEMPSITLQEQREERRRTLNERCDRAATLANENKSPVVMWCHLNDEGNRLAELVPGSVQVSGQDSDERKEEAFCAFADGQIRALITKPTIAGFGLNWQHCAHQTFFPSHSFEQWYQGVRRSWRFGQKKPVKVDVIASEGESRVLANLKRKEKAASNLFSHLVELMNDWTKVGTKFNHHKQERVPEWL